MSQNTGKIFNVPEPGSEAATTAAAAQADAKTSQLSREIEHNADLAQGAAAQAAKAAESLGPSFTGEKPASEQLRQTADAAAAEGQHDVEAAKVSGATYVEQAKSLANSTIETVQSYLPPSVGGTKQ